MNISNIILQRKLADDLCDGRSAATIHAFNKLKEVSFRRACNLNDGFARSLDPTPANQEIVLHQAVFLGSVEAVEDDAMRQARKLLLTWARASLDMLKEPPAPGDLESLRDRDISRGVLKWAEDWLLSRVERNVIEAQGATVGNSFDQEVEEWAGYWMQILHEPQHGAQQ